MPMQIPAQAVGVPSEPLYPPGPRSRIPGDLMFAFRRDMLGFLLRLAREYGDVSLFSIGRQRVCFLNHPDVIRDVLITNARNFRKGRGLERAKLLLGDGLLTSEGEFHQRQRRLVQPAFHRERVTSYGTTMGRYARATRERWRDGESIDAAAEMTRLTLAIVGKTLFDADIEGEAPEIRDALTDAVEMFSFAMFPFAELLDRLPLPRVRKFRRARERLDATIYRLIEQRRASGADRGDLLSMLLLAQDTDGDGGAMTDRQLRDEAMTLFLAGHETTANALTWTWHLLAANPEAERRLHAEVDDVLGDRAATADDLPRLRYTRLVLAESMRLYPPAWIVGRRAIADYFIGTYRIPANTILLASQYIIHRDARFFPEPERFDPERFTTEAQAARPRLAYFPFGAGPRICLGEQFAWMEGVLCLATLARRWYLRPPAGFTPTLQPLITLRPRYGMPMTVHLRANRAA